VITQTAPHRVFVTDVELDAWGVRGRSPLDDLSIEDRVSGTSGGMATSSRCPRSGTVWLTTHSGRTVVLPTNCKTWGCIECRDRLIALFEARVEIGCLRLGRCAFITLTYRLGEQEEVRTAECVRQDWREFWRRMRRQEPELATAKWLRVMELTKRKQPHLHLVMGPVRGVVSCTLEGKEFLDAMERCDCISHRMARVWYSVTGDSWSVFGLEVRGAKGAGRYLGKYFKKDTLS